MNFTEVKAAIIHFVSLYNASVIASLGAVLGYLLVTKLTLPMIERSIDQGRFKAESAQKAYHAVRLISIIVTLSVLLGIWGIDFSGLLLLSTSLITLTGVALFANWSILSNITSYMVMLFHSSFRRGNFVRIIDVDNYIEGYIAEIGLFNTRLISEDRETIIYPNNLMLARPTIINPRRKLNTIGKIDELLHAVELDEVIEEPEQLTNPKNRPVKAPKSDT